MRRFNESVVEDAALEWLQGMGYTIVNGEDIAPDADTPERTHYGEVVLIERLQKALRRLNPTLPDEALDEARRRLTVPQTASLFLNNQAFHRLFVDGVNVEYRAADNTIKGANVRVVDFEDPESIDNEFLAVNQLTVIEAGHNRRPDIVLFVNGLPLVVIELKNAADPAATIWSAFNQLQTYKAQIPSLFTSNELLIISDGVHARLGSLTADRERFMPWRTIDGKELAPNTVTEQQTLLQGVCQKTHLLKYIQGFVTFEQDGTRLIKILAAYHQYHAVGVAVTETVQAARAGGNRRGGVVWHTQGSGKSLTMTFYAGRIIQRSEMANPTLVVLTDRNDLDDQLFGTFSQARDLLHQTPEQAQSRDNLKDLLRVAAGGVVFTTIQKFGIDGKGVDFPLLSDRHNVVVIADEAHRSQYDFIDGFARHLRDALPNATFIGFTGTPIETADRSTRNIFGENISVYDMKRAQKDGATVPIYYEGRVAKLDLNPEEMPRIDPEFEEVTEDAEASQKEKAKRKWSQLAAMVGTPKRLGRVAADLVNHFEQRQEAMEGKAMVVAMSRRIAVDLYNQVVKIRPEWHTDDDATGAIKIVMTGSASDALDMQVHIRNKEGRDALAKRLKDPDDPLKLVIVRDMWLTGFDAPPLHTLYVDKPMRGHTLMQAIARVNRVFRDKPGGLIVDYLGLSEELKAALAVYTESGGKGDIVLDQKQAAALMMKEFEVCRDMFHGFDYAPFKTGSAAAQLTILAPAQEHILAQRDGKQRFLDAALKLSKAFALAVAHEDTFKVRDDVAFFQAIRGALAKTQTGAGQGDERMHHAVRQIVANAVVSDQVVDIFAAAGLDRPDVSILSDDFLAEVKDMPQKNLAVETLRKLLLDQIKAQSRANVAQSRKFSEMLAETIRAYHNRSLETAQIILELIAMAKAIRDANNRGEQLGLNNDELAFYDALSENETAVEVLGDENLRPLARALVAQVRANTSIDWNVKESVRADLRRLIKRTLRKYGYPPDKREETTTAILEQAEALAAHWA